jgi:hypothetical protein
MSEASFEFGDLKALYINCTLKRSPELSNTQGLMDPSIRLMRDHGVHVDSLRLIDHDVATGGNLRTAWNSGERFGFNPEYR